VLYQLSYCGEPESVSGERPKTPAPDIGRGAILQDKRRRLQAVSDAAKATSRDKTRQNQAFRDRLDPAGL
jgi:hypothetical protein